MALTLTPFLGFSGLFDQFESSAGPYAYVREEADGAVVELEVPRFKPEDIKVSSVGGGRLVVEGKRSNAAGAGQFLFADSMMTEFRRSLYFPAAQYDATQFKTSMDQGVLSIRVPRAPKRPEPQALTIAPKGGQLTTTTTSPEEFKAIRAMRWPPQVKVDETAESLTYNCSLPATIGRDHINLTMDGNQLNLAVQYDKKVEQKNSQGQVTYSESSSVHYSTPLSVPAGTKPEDVSTTYENGNLVISLAKHPQMIPVSPKQPATK